GEADVPYFTISGSDFVEMFVGVGASRVRDLFEQAKAEAPAIIFMDEIDAVGRQRGAGLGGGHDEREQTLNALLVEMDGFEMQDNVILLAATNRPDVLDPALLRPGRFDRQIIVDRPDLKGRAAILAVHAKNKPLADDVDLNVIARRTPGYTGADLQNLLNEAALLAARANKEKIEMIDVEEGIDRVLMGPERKSRLISEGEKLTIAYHEAGHAIVGHYTPHSDPVHKVTIIPRGGSLGATWQLPTEDRFLKSKKEMLDDIAVLLSGRAAEEITSGDVTTGAANDIERATKIAKDMVMRFGMSDVLGPQSFGEEPENVFLGRDFAKGADHGEETAATIDREVARIINEGYERARDILVREHEMLVYMADELMKNETLEGEDLEKVLATGKIQVRVKIPELGEVPPSSEPTTNSSTEAL
ncbi:MAG: ATP-dependent zinc metalloprotease FtsH, partial [Coriobacteriia bacterium]|nr:ATP-dependent zinc metalloprotease FtsH [Coriobacteriia bacterium]